MLKILQRLYFILQLDFRHFLLLKFFQPFFFARHNTKIPFYISLTSVFLNIIISVALFKEIGFLIIPIATTISSWFNAVLLFVFLKMKNLFSFNLVFIDRLIKILIASVLMGVFFSYVIYFFNDRFLYQSNLKAAYLFGSVILGLLFYLLIAILIKAFKRSDINLKY